MCDALKLPTSYIQVVIGLLLLISGPLVLARGMPDEQKIKEITVDWKCQWCPYEDKAVSRGEVEAGVGYVTNDSYKHGDYTGLDKKGAYAVGNLDYNYRSQQGTYSDVSVNDLGLDSRQIDARGGKQGSTELSVGYKSLPKLNSDSTRTPYTGTTQLRLPAGWTPQPFTQDMTQLTSALHDENLKTDRRSYAVSGVYYQTPQLSYGLSFQRDTKEGKRSAGLALGDSFATARSAVLAIPVDFVTNLGEAKVSYVKNRWQMVIGYQYSKFENNNASVRWDNAFSEPASVPQGQASLEPDNMMQQVSLTGSYQLYDSVQFTGLLSFGRLEQDQSFLPYTINGSLSPAALPRASLGGQVDTFDANLTLDSHFSDKLNVQAQYQQHEQDNNTPRATYNYVVADTTIAPPGRARANFPYSFRQRQLQLEGDYQLKQQQNVSAGYEYETVDRTYQEVDSTNQHGIWGRYRAKLSESTHLSVRLERNNRDGDDYQPVTEITPAENPLLRKYNLADRTRDKGGINISYSPQTALQLSFFTDYAKDDYANSELGLQESKQANYSLGMQYQINAAMVLIADYTMTDIDSRQAGSQGYSTADWYADNDESIDVAHLGVVYHMLMNRLKLGFDYTYADSIGKISVTTGEAFPDLKSKRHTVTLYGDYTMSESSTLHVYYRYEDYNEENWANDGVVPNTIPRVLTLGDVSPDYNIGVFVVSLRYMFN